MNRSVTQLAMRSIAAAARARLLSQHPSTTIVTRRFATAVRSAKAATAAATATTAGAAATAVTMPSAAAAAATPTASAPAAAASSRRPPLLSADPSVVDVLDYPPHSPTRLLLTCEHATESLPAGWQWSAADARLLGTHWASDPGAADFTRELGASIPSVSVMAKFSRLLCDANRPIGAETMFRGTADGIAVGLNDPARLTPQEKEKRVAALWTPYHRTLRAAVELIHPTLLVSVHSFTPLYEGQRRTVEIGVLYNDERDRALAMRFLDTYRSMGIVTELNAPWSAKDGFMYAADQFASANTGVIMLEFRNDLLTDPTWRKKVKDATKQLLNELGHK